MRYGFRNVLAGWLVMVAAGWAAPPSGTPPAALLRAEIESIVDLLQLNEPALAEAHLEIVREVFPDQTAVIAYYDGVLRYRRGEYRAALAAFRRMSLAGPEDRSDVLDYIFRAHWKLREWNAAAAAIEEMERRYGSSRLAAEAWTTLVQTLYEESGRDDGDPALRDQALARMRTVLTAYPQHPHRRWMRYILAENALQKLGNRLAGNPGGDVSAQQQRELRRLLAAYEGIRTDFPGSAEARNADFRVHYLRELLGE